jgi:hypothetical protein
MKSSLTTAACIEARLSCRDRATTQLDRASGCRAQSMFFFFTVHMLRLHSSQSAPENMPLLVAVQLPLEPADADARALS